MYEEQADLDTIQELLDRSRAGASEHLRSIVTQDRTATAAELVSRLIGMRPLALSTVSARSRPRISAVDEHLTRHYGQSPTQWGPDIAFFRIQPRWMVAYQSQPA